MCARFEECEIYEMIVAHLLSYKCLYYHKYHPLLRIVMVVADMPCRALGVSILPPSHMITTDHGQSGKLMLCTHLRELCLVQQCPDIHASIEQQKFVPIEIP